MQAATGRVASGEEALLKPTLKAWAVEVSLKEEPVCTPRVSQAAHGIAKSRTPLKHFSQSAYLEYL